MGDTTDRRTNGRKPVRSKASKDDGADGPRRKRLYVPLDPALHLRVGLWAKWSGIEVPTLISNFLEEQVKGFSVTQRTNASPPPFRIADQEESPGREAG